MSKKIINISLEIKNIALKTAFITSLRRVSSIEFVRIYVLCDDGSSAFGEAPATKAITGEDIESILKNAQDIKSEFLSVSPEDSLIVLHKKKIGSSCKAMFDMAFMSLIVPFSVKDHQTIMSDITISLNPLPIMLRDAHSALDEGMRLLKIKLGSDIKHAISVTKRVSKELPTATLLIDANQAWSYEESLVYINEVNALPLALIEQPVIAKDLDSLKKLCKHSCIPILADEAVFTLSDVINIVENNCADMINIKLMKCGGVSKAIEILEYAREKNISCMLGSMLEGPYSINAALYLAFNYSDVIKYVDLDSPLLYKNPSSELDFNFKGSHISLKLHT